MRGLGMGGIRSESEWIGASASLLFFECVPARFALRLLRSRRTYYMDKASHLLS